MASDYDLVDLYTIVDLGVQEQQFITEKELQRISFLKKTNSALALFKIKLAEIKNASGLILALDSVRDPGNLGTIIRLCDWFGVTQLLCNKETVDCYNPKVIQATMGSLTRVQIFYVDLKDFLKQYKKPIYGTFMNGDNIYSKRIDIEDGLVIMGNEANGISSEIEQYVSQKISIPRFGNFQEAESLNVATATAITLSELKRKSIEK